MNFNEDTRRWTVIGISLNSVAAPVLRKYVEQRATQLYNNVVASNHINTQNLGNRMKNYGANPRRKLNYEGINRNKTLHAQNYNLYDYKVLTAVDFSKLFIATHLSSYTAFDNACDPSALLNIIQFMDHPDFTPIRALVNQVREDIRNPWAHCNFDEWTERKYTDSMTTMRNMIQRIGLQPAEEQRIVDELNHWENNGVQLLDGSCGLDILSNVKNEVTSLQQSVDSNYNIIKCLDKKIMMIPKRLDALERRIDILQTENQDLRKELENPIRQNIREIHKTLVEEWCKQDKKFHPTRACTVIFDAVNESSNYVIVVIGNSGMGKKSIIHHIALRLRSTNKYEIIPIHSPSEIIHYRNIKDNQVFVLDDMTNENYIEWLARKAILNSMLIANTKQPDTAGFKVLISCLKLAFRERNVSRLFEENVYDIDSPELCLIPEEKTAILRQYNPKGINYINVSGPNDYFPLLCSFSKAINFSDLCPLFNEPDTYLLKEIKNIVDFQSNPTLTSCALTLNALFEEGFDIEWLTHKPNSSEREGKKIINICGELNVIIGSETNRQGIKRSFKILEDVFLKCSDRKYTFKHKFLHRLVTVVCGERLPLLFIKYASADSLLFLFTFESIQDSSRFATAILSDDYTDYYFKRILEDFRKFETDTLFDYKLKDTVYRSKLIKFLEGNIDEIQQIIIEKEMMFQYQPLILAAMFGHKDMVEFLIKAGSNINYVDKAGDNALYNACEFGYAKSAKVLLNSGAEITNHPFRSSLIEITCYKGYIKTLMVLLRSGVDVNLTGYNGSTGLHKACEIGKLKLVKLLLKWKANTFLKKSDGNTPLHEALAYKHLEIAQVLIESKYSIDSQDKKGNTPLHIACSKGYFDIASKLIACSANVTITNLNMESPLHLACRSGFENIVEILMRAGADERIYDKNGHNSIEIAIYNGHKRLALKILELSQTLCQCENVEKTVLYLAQAVYFSRSDTPILTDLCIHQVPDFLQDLHEISSKTCLHILRFVIQYCPSHFLAIFCYFYEQTVNTIAITIPTNLKMTYFCRLLKDLIQKDVTTFLYSYQLQDSRYRQELIAFLSHNAEVAYDALLEIDNNFVKLRFSDSPLYKYSTYHPSTLLTEAVLTNCKDIVNFLVDIGCNVNCKHGHFYCSTTKDMYYAFATVRIKRDDILRYCTDPLFAACYIGNVDIVKLLINHKASVTGKHFSLSPLHIACEKGHVDIVGVLLDTNKNMVQYENGSSISALILACENGRTEIAEKLLRNGWDIHTCDRDGHTPLHIACKKSDIKMTKLLLEIDTCIINVVNICRITPLVASAMSRKTEIVTLLTEAVCRCSCSSRNARQNHFIDWLCTYYNEDNQKRKKAIADLARTLNSFIHCEHFVTSVLFCAPSEFIAEYIMFKYAEEDTNDLNFLILECQEKEYFERLFQDMEGGDLTIAFCSKQLKNETYRRKLLQHLKDNETKVRVNFDTIHSCYKESPLIKAVSSGFEDIVQFCVDELSCPVEQTYNFGDTALHKSISINSIDIAKFLIQRGAEVNRLYNKTSPLQFACKVGNVEMVRFLISKAANINEFTEQSYSPLYIACENKNVELVRLLLENGANILGLEKAGSPPLVLVCKTQQRYDVTNSVISKCENDVRIYELIEILLAYRADVNATNKSNMSPLHFACLQGLIDIVKLLVKNKANVMVVGKSGARPIDLACFGGYTDIVYFLLKETCRDCNCCDNEASFYRFAHILCKLEFKFLRDIRWVNDFFSSYSELRDFAEFSCDHIQEYILKYAPSLFIANEYRLKSVYTTASYKFIHIHEHLENTYFSRLLSDIAKFNYTLLCHNNQLCVKQFRDEMLRYLNNNMLQFQDGYVKNEKSYVPTCIIRIHEYRFIPIVSVAVELGYIDVMQFLLDAGCNVNSTIGQSPLYLACKHDNIAMVQLLLRYNANTFSECLDLTSQKGNKDILALLLHAVNNMEGEKLLGELFLVLCRSCKKGWIDIVKSILQRWSVSFHKSTDQIILQTDPLEFADQDSEIAALLIANGFQQRPLA